MSYTTAGVVLFSMDSKLLIVQHPEGHWGFPKGYIEKEDKTSKDAALRELDEEVGIHPTFLIDFSTLNLTESYLDKEVVYFIGYTIIDKVNLAEGLISYKWVKLDELKNMDGFLSKKIVEKLCNCNLNDVFIKKRDFQHVNNSEAETISISPSKHAYSRVAPLEFIIDNFKIDKLPNTIDSYYINKIITRVNKFNKLDEVFYIKEEEISNCWSMINMLPSLVWKVNKVYLPGKPNGCNIGERPIDLYLNLMETFGYKINENESGYFIEKGERNLNKVQLPFPSFTGTSIAIYLAMLTKNQVEIYNASIEPEIEYLISVAKAYGYDANIDEEKRLIRIGNKIKHLKPKPIVIPFDRNVLVTRMVSSLVISGDFEWSNENRHYLEELLILLKNCGFSVEFNQHTFKISANESSILSEMVIMDCGHFPKICSDWQPLLVVLFSHFSIPFQLTDNIFENRLQIFEQLKLINNNLKIKKISSKSVVVNYYKTNESIREFYISNDKCIVLDLLNIRDAAAILIACTQTNNMFIFNNLIQLFRGYETIEQVFGKTMGTFTYEKR
ncbi:TPA: NUDIX domain-containing protein [Streptococcus suis]